MKIIELDELTGDIVLFGGPVSNLQATAALLDLLDGRRAICTGDLAAYCGDPAGTIAAIRAAGVPVVAGNCEKQLAAGAQDCGCGFVDGTACDVLSGAWFAHASAEVGADDRAWMADLPDAITFTHAGRRWAVLHGGWTAINRFLWPSDPDALFQAEIDAAVADLGPLDGIIAGHAGIAFERVVGGVHWLNAGAIGLPPHDGHAATRYAVLSEDGARLRRLDYDHGAARRAMEVAGLTQGYHTTLTTGLWPSEDVLPPAMRR